MKKIGENKVSENNDVIYISDEENDQNEGKKEEIEEIDVY